MLFLKNRQKQNVYRPLYTQTILDRALCDPPRMAERGADRRCLDKRILEIEAPENSMGHLRRANAPLFFGEVGMNAQHFKQPLYFVFSFIDY